MASDQPQERFQKAVLYGELVRPETAEGEEEPARSTRQSKRGFQTQIKKDLEAFGIDVASWRESAKDKSAWNAMLRERMEESNQTWLELKPEPDPESDTESTP